MYTAFQVIMQVRLFNIPTQKLIFSIFILQKSFSLGFWMFVQICVYLSCKQ